MIIVNYRFTGSVAPLVSTLACTIFSFGKTCISTYSDAAFVACIYILRLKLRLTSAVFPSFILPIPIFMFVSTYGRSNRSRGGVRYDPAGGL